MTTINKNIKYKSLPINLLVNKNICENILLEYINESKEFLKLSGNQKYTKSKLESNGECDCFTNKYSLDFKRFGSFSYYESLSKLRLKEFNYDNGFSIIGNDGKYKDMKVSSLDVVLRNVNHYDICNILRKKYKKFVNDDSINNMINKEINIFIKSICKQKHILILFPYLLFTDDIYKNAIELNIKYIFKNIFNVVLSYRSEICNNFDTYVSCFFNDKYYITKYENQNFYIFDTLDIDQSSSYMMYKNNKYVIKHIKLNN